MNQIQIPTDISTYDILDLPLTSIEVSGTISYQSSVLYNLHFTEASLFFRYNEVMSCGIKRKKMVEVPI